MYINNNQPTLFIYDYETFGLSPSLDRPAQFAGIRVNYSLHIVEKMKFFYCQILNDYLPNPESVIITGITPQFTLRHGLTESEFAYRIFKIFNTPKTCIIGYNNIHFDDEFSRNIFYRNFCDPYNWSYQQGNSRWDLLPVLRAFYSFCPKKMNWPINKNNKISFKLSDIAHINSIKHINIHNAVSDTHATLEIMKLLKNIQPQLFQFLFKYRTKNKLKTLIDLNLMHPIIYISNKINIKYNNFIHLLAPIAWHPNNSNILIAYNLANKNINNLLNFSIDKIHNKLFNNQEKIYEILDKISLQLIRINTCPILIPMNVLEKKYDELGFHKKIPIDYQYYSKNLDFLKTQIKNDIYLNINKLCTIIDLYMTQKNLNNQTHTDSQLYQRFFNNQDKQIIKKIRTSNIKDIKNINFYKFDNRIKSLLFFYRARNFYDTLNAKEREFWKNYKKDALLKTKKYSNYLKKINVLLNCQNNTRNTHILILLKKYYINFYDTLLR